MPATLEVAGESSVGKHDKHNQVLTDTGRGVDHISNGV
jgi:hypothetical protein